MDPYQVLGLTPTATLEEAENAYHRLLRVHHPDLHHGGSPEVLAAAELRTRALNAAINQVRTSAQRPRITTLGDDFGPSAAGPRETWAPNDNSWSGWSSDPRSTTWSAPRGARTRPTGDPRSSASSASSSSGAAGAPGGSTFSTTWDAEWAPTVDRPLVGCPLCGAQFSASLDLKQHVVVEHDVHLDGRRRKRRRRARRSNLPLWLLVPVNAVGAIVPAAVANVMTQDSRLTAWMFALAMAPSVIRVVSGDRI